MQEEDRRVAAECSGGEGGPKHVSKASFKFLGSHNPLPIPQACGNGPLAPNISSTSNLFMVLF